MSAARDRKLRPIIAEMTADPAVAGWIAPEYPRATLQQAKSLRAGASPVQIAGGVLTRQEAHTWLLHCPHTEPLAWWCGHHGIPSVRSWSVARWLRGVQLRSDWDALTRERTFPGPAGQTRTGRYLDMVDEIQDCDLVGKSVTAVFRAVAARASEAMLSRWEHDYTRLHESPTWQHYRQSMRLLDTRAALVREGREMHHCVGGYAPAVAVGQCFIYALSVCGHRSTVELSPAGRVVQHYSDHDTAPHRLCKFVLNRFLKRNGLEAT